MQKVAWVLTFILTAPVALLCAVLLLLTISAPPVKFEPQVLAASTQITSSQTQDNASSSISITAADARPLIIKNYLTKYNSPLAPFADQIVQVSDQYHLDFRLLVAIAQQESNLCKKIPADSYNCWGFGIYGDQVTRFKSYPEAINTVAKTLKSEYLDQGLKTPEEIMVKYTPPSLDKGGPWAAGVQQFLAEME